jgi:hypothetical protein
MYGAVTRLASGEPLDAAGAALELGTLSNGIDVMIGVANDLLDAEALRAGRLRMRPAPTDLRECLARCLPGAAVSGAILLDVAPDVPGSVELDPLRLRQVPSAPRPRRQRSRARCAAIFSALDSQCVRQHTPCCWFCLVHEYKI